MRCPSSRKAAAWTRSTSRSTRTTTWATTRCGTGGSWKGRRCPGTSAARRTSTRGSTSERPDGFEEELSRLRRGHFPPRLPEVRGRGGAGGRGGKAARLGLHLAGGESRDAGEGLLREPEARAEAEDLPALERRAAPEGLEQLGH